MWRRLLLRTTDSHAILNSRSFVSTKLLSPIPHAFRATAKVSARLVTAACLIAVVTDCNSAAGSLKRRRCEAQGSSSSSSDDDPNSALGALKAVARELLAQLPSLPEQPSSDAASEAAAALLAGGMPSQLGYGFVMGFSTGFCVKKVSRAGALVLGGGFICLQGLVASGYIHVRHERLKWDLESMMDLNLQGLSQVMQHSMPAGGGFVAGLVLGLKTK